jgi:hypothetical protein
MDCGGVYPGERTAMLKGFLCSIAIALSFPIAAAGGAEIIVETSRIREAGREPAATFYARLTDDYGSDLDLEAVIRENHKIDPGPVL